MIPLHNILQFTFHSVESTVFMYFIIINSVYLLLNFLSLFQLLRYMQEHSFRPLPERDSMFKPPVSLLVPAFNEEKTIKSSVESLLQLNYPEYEVIIINDGSTDGTMKTLIKEFSLYPFPESILMHLRTKPVRTVYHSHLFPDLKVVDKENGGKSDSLNTGINIAHYPLVCCMDGDSILQVDSLERIVQPFIHDPQTVAAGGTVRVLNGCEIQKGFRTKTGLPKNIWALFQVVEYLRGFLFGRMGWSAFNSLLIISGAFGLFRKDVLIQAGGYRHDTIGEDMDLTLRIHRHLRQQKKPYKVTFIPDPICWTEVPENATTLARQRIRWQRGLGESLMANIELLFMKKSGWLGWFAIPFHILFEWLGPIVEFIAVFFLLLGLLIGYVSFKAMLIFLFITIGLGVLLSVSAMVLEEVSFHIYPKRSHMLILFLISIVENLGYRQINTVWRLIGLFQWFFRKRAVWGEMTRLGSEG